MPNQSQDKAGMILPGLKLHSIKVAKELLFRVFPVVFVVRLSEMPVRARSKMQEGDVERNTDVHKGVSRRLSNRSV